MLNANRRRHVRVRTANVFAHVRIGDSMVVARVEDLGLGGALLRTPQPIAPGTALAFDVLRGTQKPLRLFGLAVEHRGVRGFGVQFTPLDADAQLDVQRLMASQQAQHAQETARDQLGPSQAQSADAATSPPMSTAHRDDDLHAQLRAQAQQLEAQTRANVMLRAELAALKKAVCDHADAAAKLARLAR